MAAMPTRCNMPENGLHLVSPGSIRWEHLSDTACHQPVRFEARITNAPEWDRLSLVGELDIASAPILQAGFDRVESDSVSVIVVDLRRLSFMDAAGLHVLVEAHERARQGGWRLVVVRGPRPVQRLLELTGFDRLLRPIYDSDLAAPARLLCAS
jgi:anti-sigma B factor antagonist